MPVERPTFHESWYRVAELHPRLRSTVQISRQHFRGLPWHVVQDHTNNAFFRLAEPAYRFIGLLDGKRSVAEAWRMASEQLGDDAPTQGEVIQLLGQLYTSNLLQAEVPADTHTLFARYKKRKQREITGYLMNIMFARLPIFDPDHFLNKWLGVVGWIFSPIGLAVWAVLLALGVYFIAQVPGWGDKIVSPTNRMLSPDNLVLLYIAFALIKACHEMGHAISCKKFGKQSGTGGEVHIIGIMFLVFTPVPYVDASSSWALTNKWHRIIVGAAGMWVELAIASIGAIVWANSNDGTVVHNFAYNVMFVAGFSTIVFNANPLLRYDGYYMLSDFLEIPNLATRGKDYIYYLVKRYIWNVRQARNPAHSSSEKFWLFIYAIASFIMRMFVTFSIMFYLSGVLEGALIILATAMALAGLITWAVVPVGKFVHYVTTNPELQRVRTRAILTSTLAITAVVVGVGFINFPDHARAQGVVEPDTDYLKEMFISEEGASRKMNAEGRNENEFHPMVKLGMPYVKEGDVLLQAENIELEAELAENEAKLAQYQGALREAMLNDQQAIPQAQTYIDTATQMIAKNKRDIESLTYKAPMTGVLIAPNLPKMQYAYIKRTDPLGLVADLHHLILRAAVANDMSAALSLEEGNQDVEIRVEGRPDILLTGQVSEYAPAGSNTLPSAALGYQVGGMLNTAPDDQHGTKTSEKFFEVRIGSLKLVSGPHNLMAKYQNSEDVPLLPGQRVVIRFSTTPKPLIKQAWTKLRQVFQQKFHLG